MAVEKEIEQLIQERGEVVSKLIECDSFLSANKVQSPQRARILREKNEYTSRVANIKSRLRVLQNQMEPKSGAVFVEQTKPMVRGYTKDEHYRGQKVSDHAVVRWLERKHGVDIDQIRKDMYADAMMATAGTTAYMKDGMFMAVRNDITYVVNQTTGIIVTCYQQDKEAYSGVN